MSRIVIEDFIQTTPLDETALAATAGGMDVQIDQVHTTVRSADDEGILGPNVFGFLVDAVVRGLRG